MGTMGPIFLRFARVCTLAGFTLAAVPAGAYFELELVSGGTMVADSYVEEGDAYRLYRPGGELRIDKERVASIRERDGRIEVPTAPKVEAAPAPAAAKPAARPATAVAPASAEPLPQTRAELEALERKLTRDIILGHREALFAKNRGEDEDALKQRKKELKRLEERRQQVQGRLDTR